MGGIKDTRRKEIIDSAMQVFGANGFHKAKMGEIAEKAGIGKGTIYEYFSSKKELYEEMLKFIIDGYFTGISMIFSGEGNLKEKLITFSKYHGDFMVNHFELAETTIRENESFSEELKRYILKKKIYFFESMKKLLNEGIYNMDIKEDIDKDTAICMILGAVNQTYAYNIHTGRCKPEEIDPEPMIEMLLKGIGKR